MECSEMQNELLTAYADHEADGAQAAAVERHLQNCRPCQAEYARQTALRETMKTGATYYTAPPHLLRRVRNALALPDATETPWQRRWKVWHLGPALVSIIAIAWSVGFYLATPNAEDGLADEIVSGHIRSQLSTHLRDVESSDRHTVKPWFNGRLDFSPPVYDLATDGFPLMGGRVDYLNRRPVAALVYSSGGHTINLFVLPVDDPAKDRALRASVRQGYSVVHWVRRGMGFWAVSDTDPADLGKFGRSFLAKQSG
ncbi:MAG: anti-sigma factor family protein [Sulfurifustis sp.]